MASQKKIGLFGGTFDPPHKGHVICAEEARKALGLDEIIFIPAGQPSFKRDQFVTPAHHRVEMVKRAIVDNPHFSLDTLEVERSGITFTVDTLKSFKASLPDTQFFFICGADAVLTLPKWKAARELVELAQFVGVGRPGSLSLYDSEAAANLRSFTENVRMIEIDAMDVSSSEVRKAIKDNKSIEGLVPLQVEEYIMENQLYTKAFELSEFAYAKTDLSDFVVYEDSFCKENYKQMKALLKMRVKPSRYEHSVMVAKTAKKIAKAYGLDERQARMAGLLHDWDKALSNERLACRVEDYQIPISAEVVKESPQILHGMTAARVLREQFPQLGEEVFQAIDRHTVAAVDMAPLDMVIFAADKLEPTHHVAVYEAIAKKIGKIPLEDLFFEVHKAGLLYLIESNRALNTESVKVWNSYISHD